MGRILAAGVLTGLLGTLAYPELYIWPLAFVAYIPLLVAIRDRRPRDRFLAGWVAGIVLHGGVYAWIYDTARIMSSLPPWLSALVLLAFALAHGLCQGFIALAVEPVRLRTGRAWPFAVGVTAAVVEALFPHLFPWYLGNALYRTITLTQVADLVGIYGLSVLCFATSASLVDAWMRKRSRGWRAAVPPLAVVAGVLAAVAGYGTWRIASIRAMTPDATLRVALLQPFMTGEEKGDLKGMGRRILYDKSVTLLQKVRDEPLDLIVLPEGGFPFYFVPEVEAIAPTEGEPIKLHFGRRFMGEIRATRAAVVFGSLMAGDDGRVHNAAILVGPDAEPVVYEKRRLVPFGEFMPLSDTFPALKRAVKNVGDFKPGARHVAFVVAGRSLMPTICYEAIFPAFVRAAANEEPRAQAILNLTNDVWFGQTAAPELHLMVQVTRAIEERMPLIRSTNSGVSAFVDAVGEITGRTGVYEVAILRGDVPIVSIWSFYRQFGDVFLWLSAAIVIVLMLLHWRRRPGHTIRERSFSGKSPVK